MIMQFIATQAFLTLISLPILTAWGLPTSLWSPLGNLFFSPILSVYLFCAVCVFFSELFCIPNRLLIVLLEYVSRLWLWCMSLLPTHATIGFVKPHIALLFIMPIFACIVLWCVRKQSHTIRAISFICLLIALSFALKCSESIPANTYTIDIEGIQAKCVYNKGHIAVIVEDSCLARKPSAENWLVYQMMSDIVARTGVVSIDHFILLHPRKRLFDALATLCQHVTIQHVYIPKWEGKLYQTTWFAYVHMKKLIQKCGSKVHLLDKKRTVPLSDNIQILFMQTEKMYKYQDIRYTGYTFDIQNFTELHATM